jgi:hypothetical protein
VREEATFEARRLQGSASVPAGELRDLLFELPEPTTPLALVAGSAAEGEAARALLWEKGWRRLSFLFVAAADLWRVAEQAGVTGEKKKRKRKWINLCFRGLWRGAFIGVSPSVH